MARHGVPDRQQVTEQVRAMVAEQLGIPVGSVSPEAHVVQDLGADSLDMTELAIAIEDRFGFEVPESEYSRLTTVAEVADYVSSRLA